MAIQMRRGNSVDFDPTKMVPGEWAVSQDDSRIYMCIRQGVIVEVGTSGSIIHYVEDAEAWAVGERGGVPVDDTDPTYHNNSKYYATQASNSAGSAYTSEVNAASSELNAATSETNAETYWGYVHDAVDVVIPEVTIDFDTGNLEYSGSQLLFWVDVDSGMLMWNVAHA